MRMKLRSHTFFKYVWRFNALAIAAACCFAIVLCIILLAMFVIKQTNDRRVMQTVNVDPEVKVQETFKLDGNITSQNTEYLQVPLIRTQEYDKIYYSKTSDYNAVNYLYINNNNAEQHWLFPTNEQLIISTRSVLENPVSESNKKPKVVGELYTVVERDTNGNKTLSRKDEYTIGYANVGGKDYRKLIERVEDLITINQIDSSKLMILYQKQSENYYATYSLPEMKLLTEGKISKVGQ